MNRLATSVWSLIGCLCIGWGWLAFAPAECAAQNDTLPPELRGRVNSALQRGIDWLKRQTLATGTAEGSLVGYALLKGHVDPQHPLLVAHRDALITKIGGGVYNEGRSPQHHTYEAACDAMFLEATDPQLYRPQLEALRDYFVRNQRPSGGWDYPHAQGDPSGDTSITQYAILGLWASQRAGLNVPVETWSRAGRFFQETQRSDGTFTYHPYESNFQRGSGTPSMTAAGLGSVLVVNLMLFGESIPTPAPAPASRRKFGVLEPYVEPPEPRQGAANRAPAEVQISRDALRKLISPSEQAVGSRFQEGWNGPHPLYFLYGIERIGALTGKESVGGIKWFEDGCRRLVDRQDREGFWVPNSVYSSQVTTSFAILFLSRATETLVPQRRPPRKLGGGLLVGGRGLPGDLKAVAVDGGVVSQTPPKGEIDSLIAELEQPVEVSIPAVQKNLVEMVEFERPEALIGQIDRLRRLLEHENPEVRQLAAWALARSGDYREAPRLIARLQDPDLVVAWEASLGLCWLSRRPMGVTAAGETAPLAIMPPGANRESPDPPDEDLAREIARWRDRSSKAWDAWYQQYRPYEERNDQRDFRTR